MKDCTEFSPRSLVLETIDGSDNRLTMDSAIAGLLGAAIGFAGNAVVTCINKHYDEKKARRELLVKTAWDHYSSVSELAKTKEGGVLMPFELFVLHTTRVIELALRAQFLSNEETLKEMHKIHELNKQLTEMSNEAQPRPER